MKKLENARVLLLIALLALSFSYAKAQAGSYGDCVIAKNSFKAFGDVLLVEGAVKNNGQFSARVVTVECRGVADDTQENPPVLWQQTVLVRDVAAGASRAFSFKVKAPPEKQIQMRIVRVDF